MNLFRKYTDHSSLVLFLIFSIACDKEEEVKRCPLQFIEVKVSIQHSSGKPVILDTAVVTNQKTGTIKASSHQSIEESSIYTITSDSESRDILSTGTTFLFKGYLEGNDTLTAHYKVGKDVCNIFKMEGPDTLIVK